MKKILVPTDFSECANRAAASAINIANISGYKIHFLHFLTVPIDWIHMEFGETRMYPDIKVDVDEANRKLMQLAEMASKAGVDSEYEVSFNSDATQIVKYIADHQVALVVMGSHGASGVKELFIGSNAQKIARLSKVPVLIIKNFPIEEKIHNIFFVSDFEPEVMEPFNELVNLSEIWDAKIHLVYVNTPSYFIDSWEIADKMEHFKAAAGNRIIRSKVINAYVFEEGLERYCIENGGGIITMATHGRKGISRMFYGSLTERVVNHVEEPVLSLRIPEAEKANSRYADKDMISY